MKTKYAFQGLKENMARAISKDVGVSTKASIEIANFIRGKSSSEAKNVLERVLKKKQAIPFKRFTDGVGHRKGASIGAGRFPEKATEAFITIIKQCEANAQAKGLSSDLRIVHLVVQKGSNMFRHGRQRRRKYKRTHLEIVLEEIEPEKASAKKVSKVETKEVSKKPESVVKEAKKEVKETKPKAEVSKTKTEESKTVKKVEAKPVDKTVVANDSKTVKKEEALPNKKDDSKKESSEDKK